MNRQKKSKLAISQEQDPGKKIPLHERLHRLSVELEAIATKDERNPDVEVVKQLAEKLEVPQEYIQWYLV